MSEQKFYINLDGKRQEVSIGDTIFGTKSSPTGTTTVIATVTEDSIPMLKKFGIIEKAPSTGNFEVLIGTILHNLAVKMNESEEMSIATLKTVYKASPIAVFSIMLKEAALTIDSLYPDCITNCEEVYVISTLDGKIHKVKKQQIKSYKNFAAFRTVEDALKAYKVIKSYLHEEFSK
jgi:hypothetical protein